MPPTDCELKERGPERTTERESNAEAETRAQSRGGEDLPRVP